MWLQRRYSRSAFGEWAQGHADLLTEAQARVGLLTVIANNNASGTAGRQFERWCHTDFDGGTIADDIVALEQAGDTGTLALVHGGEPCDAAMFSLSLSAFLVGAGVRSYFACTDGWLVSAGWSRSQRAKEYDYPLGAPLGKATRSTVVIRSAAENGVPGSTGAAAVGVAGTVAMATVFKRRFASGTNVTLLLPDGATQNGTGCIYWANGAVTGDPVACA